MSRSLTLAWAFADAHAALTALVLFASLTFSMNPNPLDEVQALNESAARCYWLSRLSAPPSRRTAQLIALELLASLDHKWILEQIGRWNPTQQHRRYSEDRRDL